MLSIYNLLIVAFVASSVVHAENKIGNGGNVIYCKTKKLTNAQLLDFYEEDFKFKTKLTDAFKIVEKQFQELKIVAPKLATQYLNRLQEVKSDIDFKNDISLTAVPDSLHLFKPLSSDCEVKQIAIRKPEKTESEKRFIIRQDLWKLLEPTHQAGLLSHEIIYEHFLKLGEKDSVKARKLNRYLYQEKFNSDQFWHFIQDLEIPIYP